MSWAVLGVAGHVLGTAPAVGEEKGNHDPHGVSDHLSPERVETRVGVACSLLAVSLL